MIVLLRTLEANIVETYNINEETKFILYGAATTGKIIINVFGSERVVGFFDKRFDEINQFEDKPVRNLDYDFGDKDELVVVVAIKNVFEHEEIAKKIYQNGYTKIIYKPYSLLMGNTDSNLVSISDAWDSIVGKHLLSPHQVSSYIDTGSIICVEPTIVDINGKYALPVPIELVYTDIGKKGDRFSDICVLSLYPHIEFFKYLLGEHGYSYDNYIQFCTNAALSLGGIEITKRWKENVLKNRIQTFVEMKRTLEVDSDFFVRNAPDVSWNEKGYFNLHSGKHRIAFLAAHNYSYVYVKMTQDDYYSWIHNIDAIELKDKMNELKYDALPIRVLHPFFYKNKNDEPYFWQRINQSILMIVEKERQTQQRKLNVYYAIKNNIVLYELMFHTHNNVYSKATFDLPDTVVEMLLPNSEIANKQEISKYDIAVVEEDQLKGNADIIICLQKQSSQIESLFEYDFHVETCFYDADHNGYLCVYKRRM